MSDETFLTLVERQFIDEIQRGNFREVKPAPCFFTSGNVEGVLRSGNRVTPGNCGEDLAGVIHRLAPREVKSARESMPVMNPQLALQSMIGGPSSILAIAEVAEIAIRTLGRLAKQTDGCAGSARRCARCHSCRNE